MASIDKIYGTKEQYDLLLAWSKKYLPEAVQYIFWENRRGPLQPIAVFPEHIDMAILKKQKNCPAFVLDRIKDQYSYT